MSAEALAATKWQDRREAWESVTAATDAETLTRLSKETNGAVLDAALDAVARVASPELAPALPHRPEGPRERPRGATQRRGLRAVVALQQVAPNLKRRTPSSTASRRRRTRVGLCLREGSDGVRAFQGVALFNSDRLATAVAKLASAANGDAEKPRSTSRSPSTTPPSRNWPENAKKAVAKLRGNTPPPPPPEADPAAAARIPAQARHDPSSPAEGASPEKGDDLLAALARRGVSPPYDAAFEGSGTRDAKIGGRHLGRPRL